MNYEEATKWSEHKIAYAVARDVFPWQRWICVPNVDWGLLPHEADLVALSPSDWLSEIEIKISVADFKRDLKKPKHAINGHPTLISKFYYAMPAEVHETVRGLISPGLGIIIVNQNGRAETLYDGDRRSTARKVTDAEREQLLRLGYIRYWARQHATREMVAVAHAQIERALSQATSLTPESKERADR